VSHRSDALSHVALVLLGALLLLLAVEQEHSSSAAWLVGAVLLGVGARGLLAMPVDVVRARRRSGS
jgi:hypothetical protein